MADYSQKQLRIGHYFARTREAWQRLAIFVIFFIDLVLLYTFGLRLILFLGDAYAHQRVVRELTYPYLNLQQIHQSFAAAPLQVERITAVPSGTGYDLVARIKNPNQSFLAESVTYAFSVGGQTLPVGQTFVLPGQSKYVFSFNTRPLTSPSPQLQLQQTSWDRVSLTASRQEVLESLSVEDISWRNVGGDFQVSAVLRNNSAYGFWSVGLAAVATRSGSLVGANYISISALAAGEVRAVTLIWPGQSLSATAVDIEVDVNVYDSINYINN